MGQPARCGLFAGAALHPADTRTRLSGERQLALYVNLAHGASWQQRTLELGPSYAFLSIAAADLNPDLDGDQDLDVLAGKAYPSDLTWNKNLGAASSWEFHWITRDMTAYPYAVQVLAVDIDGDSDLDVVSGSDLGGLLWYENGP